MKKEEISKYKVKRFEFRTTITTFNKLHNLVDEVLELEGLGHYHKSTLIEELLFDALKERKSYSEINKTFTHTQKSTQLWKDEREEKFQDLLTKIKETPITLSETIALFLSSVFGSDSSGYFRTNIAHLSKFLSHISVTVLNLKPIGINELYLIDSRSKWIPQLEGFIFDLEKKHCIFSISKKKRFRLSAGSQITSQISNLISKSTKSEPDPAQKFVIHNFKYTIGLEAEPRGLNIEPVLSEIIQLRAQTKFEKADELLRQYQNNKALSNDTGMQLINNLGGIKQ